MSADWYDRSAGTLTVLADPVDTRPLWEITEHGYQVPDTLTTAAESRLAWMTEGHCRQADPELFFPDAETPAKVRAAKVICAACPVLASCDAYINGSTFAEHGVWAGTTTAERQAAKRKTFSSAHHHRSTTHV